MIKSSTFGDRRVRCRGFGDGDDGTQQPVTRLLLSHVVRASALQVRVAMVMGVPARAVLHDLDVDGLARLDDVQVIFVGRRRFVGSVHVRTMVIVQAVGVAHAPVVTVRVVTAGGQQVRVTLGATTGVLWVDGQVSVGVGESAVLTVAEGGFGSDRGFGGSGLLRHDHFSGRYRSVVTLLTLGPMHRHLAIHSLVGFLLVVLRNNLIVLAVGNGLVAMTTGGLVARGVGAVATALHAGAGTVPGLERAVDALNRGAVLVVLPRVLKQIREHVTLHASDWSFRVKQQITCCETEFFHVMTSQVCGRHQQVDGTLWACSICVCGEPPVKSHNFAPWV